MRVLSWVYVSEPTYDARLAPIRVQDEGYLIADEDADPVEPHLAREIGQYLLAILKGHSKECVRERLGDDTKLFLRIFRAYHLIVADSGWDLAIIPE